MVVLFDTEILVEDTEPTDEDEPQNLRYDIMSFPSDFTVRVMYEKWQSGQLVIPDFERRYVWNLPQASRLIESFLLGLPIPQVFLYREHSSPILHVIDGHQRLATIARFYNGIFSSNREFRLRGINPAWDGRNYIDLSDNDRAVLDDSILRSIVIRQIQPDDNSSIYQIFERLNTGGTQLNPMEIRRAIYRGGANDLLDKLNETPDWRSLIGQAEPDSRFRDVEIILRVLALSNDWRNYSKPMKNFITDYMDILDNANTEYIQNIEQQFYRACEIVRDQLGAKPFHLRQRLNLAALDAVMACSIESIDSLRSDLLVAFQELLNSPHFIEAVTYNTSDASVLSERFELARGALVS